MTAADLGAERRLSVMALLQRLVREREAAVDILAVFVLIQVVCVVVSLLAPGAFPYLSAANISIELKSIPILGTITIGVGILMIAGEFDLSVGANYTFTGIVAATLIENGMAAFLAALIGLALGIAIGLLNGAVTLTFRIPSFITTLGSMLFWGGITLFYHGTSSIRFSPDPLFTSIMAGSIGALESPFLWLVALSIIAWALLHRHQFGNHVFAVGGNPQAATAIGISPDRVKLAAFAIAGFCAALSGLLAATRVGTIQPGEGSGLELQAIAACVIGGVALAGGRGHVLGMFLGAAMIYTIQDILFLSGAPGFYLNMFVGLLIVAATVFNSIVGKRRT